MSSLHRRIRPVRSVMLAVVLSAAATACGVTADTTAGSVGERDVSVADVDELARDEVFVGLAGEELPESSLPGDLARTVLAFELERAALHDELSRWGLSVEDSEREAAAASLAAEDDAGWGQLAPRSRELLADYFAAQQVLAAHFAQLNPDDDTLRRFYDASPGLWSQTCAAVVALDPADVDAADAALGDGVEIESLPEQVEGAELVASADEQCIDDAQVLPQLRDAFEEATVGEVPDALVVDAGVPSAFLFRIDERRVVSFDDARGRLEEIVGSLAQQGPMPWVRLMLVHAEIDPRFGSGVVQNPDGSILIDPPVAPPVPTTTPAPVPPEGLEQFEDLDEIPVDDLTAG